MPSLNPTFCLAVLSLFSLFALLLRIAYVEGYRAGAGRSSGNDGRTRFQ